MKLFGKAEGVAKQILERFESGDVPAALAQVFIHRNDNIPSRQWSMMNQLAMFCHLTNDARGFKQWKKAGRKVSKGCKAIYILGPCIGKRKDPDTGEEKSFVFGFKSIPVFRLEDTEIVDAALWEKCSGVDHDAERWIQDLPLRDVAEEWGLKVDSYNGQGVNYLGFYMPGSKIAVGTENLSTWAHELCHAADDRRGNLKRRVGQDPDNEIVAELGGSVLLSILGHENEADLGGCMEYITRYSAGDKGKAISAAMKLLKRTCEAVTLILDTATQAGVEAA